MAREEKNVNILARPSFLISAILIVAILVGLAALIATRDTTPAPVGQGEPATTSEVEAGASGVEASSDGAQSDSVCGLSALDDVIPAQALPSNPVPVGERIAVPSVDGYGPGVSEGVSYCFSHNPSGAILSAANFMIWFSSQERLDEVVPALMAENMDRDRLLAQIEAQWQGETGSPLQIRGFKYEDRGDDHALVVLAVSLQSMPDKIMAWPLVMVWQDGDWKVEAPASDSWGERMIDSLPLEGFIEWSA